MDCEPTNQVRAVRARLRGALRRALDDWGRGVSEATCGTCRFYSETGMLYTQMSQHCHGFCNRFPPARYDKPATVVSTHWCGEFSSKDAPHAPAPRIPDPFTAHALATELERVEQHGRDDFERWTKAHEPRADDAEALLRRWIAWYVGGDVEDLGELVERTRERHASSVERRDGDSWSITHAGIRWPAYASTEMDANTIRDALNRDSRALAIVQRLAALPGYIFGAHVQLDSIIRDARALAEEEVRNE